MRANQWIQSVPAMKRPLNLLGAFDGSLEKLLEAEVLDLRESGNSTAAFPPYRYRDWKWLKHANYLLLKFRHQPCITDIHFEFDSSIHSI
jgi:hypothetical protein